MMNTELLSEHAQEKIDKLPFFMRYVIYKLVDCIDDMINGKCDNDTIVSTMSTLENNARCRYSNDDLMNYDEAGKALGYGTTDRVGLKKLLDKNDIKEVIINNMKCGFPRASIMLLKERLQVQDKNSRQWQRKY